eukprot:EC722071.1.p1 GENE.EC722071.1~~EC722071.1.p1  ORF type:complete len:189 (+),score=42.69 EC722071.1:53-568(+)
MIIPKKNRQLVYTQLFKDGVMTAPVDMLLPKHPQMDVPNLEVLKLMESFVSKGLVKRQYAWRWAYWTLTDEGIAFLREYLHLAADVVPDTLKKPMKATTPSGRRFEGDREREPRGDRPRRFDRDSREPREPRQPRGGEGKEGSAPADYKPTYGGRGGDRAPRVGRGAAPQQ